MQKKGLLLVAHGSRSQLLIPEIEAMLAQIEQNLKNQFDLYRYAFLEIKDPFVEPVVQSMAKKEINQIMIFPYFLNSGKHINLDLPQKIEVLKQQYPSIKFNLVQHLGSFSGLALFISNELNQKIRGESS